MKSAIQLKPRIFMTPEALSRMQRSATSTNGVGVRKGSHVAKLQGRLATGEHNASKGAK